MADWNDFRRSLESQPVAQPPLSALRERRRRRQQRKAIAATFAVVMVGSAAGLAVLGETGRRPAPGTPVAVPTALSQIVNNDRVIPPKDYEDYVVTDVDFVSEKHGFALGLRCVKDACDVATWQTTDGGETWGDAVPVATKVPRASYADEDAAGGGVRSLRMVDGLTGYAFNPDLYVTRDGGRTWTRAPQRSKVTSVSVAGGSVWVAQRGCGAGVDCDLVVRAGTVGETALRDLAVPETNAAPAIVRRSGERDGYLVTWDAPDSSPAALHRTRDGGRTWTKGAMPCADATAVSLSARPGAPLWMVCSTDVARSAYTSTDRGATWRRLPSPPADGIVTDVLAVDGRTAIVTTQQPGAVHVWDGDAWVRGDVARAYGFGNLDYADGLVYAMGDAGQLWGSKGSPGRPDAWFRLALPPGAKKAASTAPATRGLRDPGVSWMGLSFLDASRGWAVGERCSDGECRAIVRRTVDGGDTWSDVASPPYVEPEPGQGEERKLVWEVVFADERNGWLDGDRLYVTHDGGATWRPVQAPPVSTLVARGGTVWALGYAGCDASQCVPVVLRGPASGSRLDGRPLPAAGERAQLAVVDERTAYLVGDDRTMLTDDGGETWQNRAKVPCLTGSVSAWDGESVWVVCAAYLDGKQSQAVSTDGGRTWTTSPLPGTGPRTGELVAFSEDYAWRTGANRGVLVTRDGGKTWTGAPAVGDPAGALTFADARHGWLIASKVLYRTTDGEHWERLG